MSANGNGVPVHSHRWQVSYTVLQEAQRIIAGHRPDVLTEQEVVGALLSAYVVHLVEHSYANDPLGPPV